MWKFSIGAFSPLSQLLETFGKSWIMDYGFCNEFQQTQWLKRDLYHRSVGQKSASTALNWSLFSRSLISSKMNIKVSADLGFFLEAQEMNLLSAHWVGWLNSAICDSSNEFLISLLVVSNRFLSASRGGPHALAYCSLHFPTHQWRIECFSHFGALYLPFPCISITPVREIFFL